MISLHRLLIRERNLREPVDRAVLVAQPIMLARGLAEGRQI
jgi:hypothetical protein